MKILIKLILKLDIVNGHLKIKEGSLKNFISNFTIAFKEC
jgi:hypothetical protein